MLQVFHNFSKIVVIISRSNSFANQRPPAPLGLAWLRDREARGRRYMVLLSFFFSHFDWYWSKSNIWTKCEDGSCVLLLPKSSVRVLNNFFFFFSFFSLLVVSFTFLFSLTSYLRLIIRYVYLREKGNI